MDISTLKQTVRAALIELATIELKPLTKQEQHGDWIAEALIESLTAALKYAHLYEQLGKKEQADSDQPKKRVMPGRAVVPRSVVETPLAAKVTPEKEPKEDSSTTRELRAYLLEATPPFTRGSIYKGLKWNGTALTRAAVAGWIGRALKRGELVEPGAPGTFYLAGLVPSFKIEETPISAPVQIMQPTMHVIPAGISVVLAKVARGESVELDVINGAAGLR
jgi:hypothetical protein